MWTKHTGHVSFVTKLAVKLWLCEELFLTGLYWESNAQMSTKVPHISKIQNLLNLLEHLNFA